jgi:hypothetical protein
VGDDGCGKGDFESIARNGCSRERAGRQGGGGRERERERERGRVGHSRTDKGDFKSNMQCEDDEKMKK